MRKHVVLRTTASVELTASRIAGSSVLEKRASWNARVAASSRGSSRSRCAPAAQASGQIVA
jgi:hypothetical protein